MRHKVTPRDLEHLKQGPGSVRISPKRSDIAVVMDAKPCRPYHQVFMLGPAWCRSLGVLLVRSGMLGFLATRGRGEASLPAGEKLAGKATLHLKNGVGRSSWELSFGLCQTPLRGKIGLSLQSSCYLSTCGCAELLHEASIMSNIRQIKA